MKTSPFLMVLMGLASCASRDGILPPSIPAASARPEKPNIIYIMADNLGYGDLGCYGQEKIRTPNLDRMASEGTRFTQFYAGSTICAPSRCVLMTGLHTGHARIRGNSTVPLLPGDVTIAEVLKSAGYATAICGKWGLGEQDSTGIPTRQGFDFFFGYLNQVHAHNYYPEFLWRNEERAPLRNVVVRPQGRGAIMHGGAATTRVDYSHDLIVEQAFDFIRSHRERPFFLYWAPTIPHVNNESYLVGRHGAEVPDDGEYADRDWPEVEKGVAAMISRLDRDVGRLLALLKDLAIDGNTVVFFTSDNGPQQEGGRHPAFFKSSGPLRGILRDMYDGGIRVPMIVRWPGRIAEGAVSDHVWAMWDILPTAAAIAGAEIPGTLDGISMLPALLGKPQAEHAFLYWEFHERGFDQAVRMGDWKAVRRGFNAPLELYDLKTDLGERNDVARRHPDIVSRIEACLTTARTESELWKIRREPK